jgi:probable rRNA maturation factor
MKSAGSTVLFGAIPVQLKLSAIDKRELARFARVLSSQLAPARSFVCLIAGDRELHRLNLTFLGHDYPTDVLSFPSQPGSAELGEIAISIERAAAQALEFGHPLLDEIRVLMLHGILHLSGLDHENDDGEMARAEKFWCSKFGLPPTLIHRQAGALAL